MKNRVAVLLRTSVLPLVVLGVLGVLGTLFVGVGLRAAPTAHAAPPSHAGPLGLVNIHRNVEFVPLRGDFVTVTYRCTTPASATSAFGTLTASVEGAGGTIGVICDGRAHQTTVSTGAVAGPGTHTATATLRNPAGELVAEQTATVMIRG